MVKTPLHEGRSSSPARLGYVARWQLWSTVALLVAAAVLAVVGIVDGIFDGVEVPATALQVQDAVALVLGVPLGAVGLWAATQGSPRGAVAWLGALGFLAYVWGSYLVMLVFTPLYLCYALLFGLALVTLVGGLAGEAPADAASALGADAPTTALAGALGGAAAVLAAAWLWALLPETVAGEAPGAVVRPGGAATAVVALELGVLAPTAAALAVLVQRGDPRGVGLAGVLLVTLTGVGVSLLAIGLRLYGGVDGVAVVDLGLAAALALLAGAATAVYLHAMGATGSSRSGAGWEPLGRQ